MAARTGLFAGSDATETSAPTWTRYLILAVAVAHVMAAFLVRTPGFGWGEDDVAYLLLAQELRHFSYREIQDVLAPVHARFPPVFPLMLAVVGAPFNDSLDVLLAFVALCSAGSILFLYAGARRVVGEEVAVLASILYAVNPSAIWDASNLMAEAPFKLLVMIALWALTRERETTRFAVVAGVATCLAALTRSAGVVFVVALFAYWVVSRQYRRAMVFAVAACATVGVWLAFTFNAPDPDTRRLYVSDLGARGRRASEGILSGILHRIVPRARRLSATIFPFVLSVPTVAHTIIDNVLWLVVTLAFGVCGLFVLLRRWLAAATFLGAYLGLLLIWRYALERFVSPIVPLCFVVLLAGASWLATRFVPGARRWVVVSFTMLMAVGAIPRNVGFSRRALTCDRARPAESPACWPDGDREYLQLALWVRDSTPGNALMFVSKERAFFVHSGHRSINQDRALQEDSLSLGDYLRSRGVSYSAVSPIGVRSGQHNQMVTAACGDFALVHRFSASTMLLRVRARGEAPDGGETCATLRDWYRREALSE